MHLLRLAENLHSSLQEPDTTFEHTTCTLHARVAKYYGTEYKWQQNTAKLRQGLTSEDEATSDVVWWVCGDDEKNCFVDADTLIFKYT